MSRAPPSSPVGGPDLGSAAGSGTAPSSEASLENCCRIGVFDEVSPLRDRNRIHHRLAGAVARREGDVRRHPSAGGDRRDPGHFRAAEGGLAGRPVVLPGPARTDQRSVANERVAARENNVLGYSLYHQPITE